MSVLIPCYNEAAAIPALFHQLSPTLKRLCERGPVEVVLVDDGSTDGTAEVIEREKPEDAAWDTLLLQHARNLGLGAALRTGFNAVRGGRVVTYDSDCTYAPELILGLLERLELSGASIVCGSPYHPEGAVEGVPGWRLGLSRGASKLYSCFAHQHLYCYTSLFRAYRRPCACADWITQDGFVGVTELLLRALEEGAEAVELPVTLRRRTIGVSKMRTAATIAGHLRLMGRYLQRRLRAAYAPGKRRTV